MTAAVVTGAGSALPAALEQEAAWDGFFAAHYADRIVAIGDGQVVETGTPAEILRPEVLERIFKTPCSVVDGPHGPLAVYY